MPSFYGKNPINADYSALTEKIETNPKLLKFKVGNRVRITKYKNIFSKGYTGNLVNKNICNCFCVEH